MGTSKKKENFQTEIFNTLENVLYRNVERDIYNHKRQSTYEEEEVGL